jgi:hypothetical protein
VKCTSKEAPHLLLTLIFDILINICMVTRSWGSPVIIVTGLQAGWLGFNSCQGEWWDFFLLTTSGLALGPIQPLIQWELGVSPPGLKCPGCEADHSPPSSAKIEGAWSYTSTPRMYSWHDAYLSSGKNLRLLSIWTAVKLSSFLMFMSPSCGFCLLDCHFYVMSCHAHLILSHTFSS